MRLSFAGHRPRLAALLLSIGVLGTTASALPLVASQAATKVPFSLSLSESTVTVAPGSSATLTLSIVRSKGFSSPVYLGSRSVPKGVRISTGANPISRSTSVKVAVGDSVSPKTYFATLTGSSKGRTSTRTIKIVVATGDAVGPTVPTTPPTTTPTAATLPPTPTTLTPPTTPTSTAPAFNDYTLTAEPAAITLPAFGTATSTIKITRTGTFNDILDFAVDGLPANVTPSFSTATATSPSVTMTLTSNGASAGVSELTVRSRARTTKIALTVVAGTALTANPAAATVGIGASSNVTMRWGRAVPTGSVVSWTAVNLPAGVTATFVPNNTASVETTMTLSAAATAVAGLTNITVTSTAGALTDSVTVPVTVGTATGPAGTGTLTPNTAAVNPNASTTVLFTPAGINVNQPLVLSQTGLPANVTIAATVSGTGLNLTLQTNPSTVLGTYTITFTATQGTVVSSAALTLNVIAVGATTTTTTTPSAAAGFTLTPSPASLTVARGATGNVGITPVFTGAIAPVTFGVTGAPAGVGIALTPNPSAGSATMTLNVPATTAAGSYTLVVTGTISGRGSVNLNIPLTIS